MVVTAVLQTAMSAKSERRRRQSSDAHACRRREGGIPVGTGNGRSGQRNRVEKRYAWATVIRRHAGALPFSINVPEGKAGEPVRRTTMRMSRGR
eukprot:6403246-Pyramimonas_sp.AAC.1